ncbi:DUF1127 domain-containing protein [Pseudomonas zhanjiangensis]|uniref:DUF1127 domain-containing protein n=1 Tax=Pseudomonas zhanjiangensis TaxID=3239015 RepID=A0ABV3YQF6_9PSED
MNGLGDVRLVLRQQELQEAGRAAPAASGAVGGRRWTLFWRRWRTRRALLELSAEQLADIGLSRAEARAEALRPFWRL